MKSTTYANAWATTRSARAIATQRQVIVLGILTTALLTGCATATGRGQAALYAGRYDEAAARFEEALAREPGSLAARIGLGIARYRMGALDEAQRALTEALAQDPDVPVPHLYLGLIALLRGQDAAAGESLRRYAVGVPPRLAAHVERALRALAGGAVSAEMRRYMAASIEDQSAWAGELDATRQALAHSELRRITEDRTLLLLPRACHCR